MKSWSGLLFLAAAVLVGCGSGSADGAAAGGAGEEAASAPSRFITNVISYTAGPCAGFGQKEMPEIVYGPPVGGGADQGSVNVVSLGNGGEIIVSFAPNAIVDGPGVDFIVFENPFFIGGDPTDPYAEPGEVSVSEDGVHWATFPCTATSYPYGACGGWHPIYSNPDNDISPFDPATAGGEAYDLADVGIERAVMVRVRDKTHEGCDVAAPASITNGFDLDAMAIVNAALP